MSRSVSSNDAEHPPFKNDTNRGKWESSQDFYYACVGHAFNTNFFTFVPFAAVKYGGQGFYLPVLLNFVIFNVPIFFIQSYLGQFSSTGYISVFRIAPLLKGIGYVTLLLNLTSITCLSVQAAIELTYLLNSLRTSMPWMHCGNSWNTDYCISPNQLTRNDSYSDIFEDSTVQYFHNILGINNGSDGFQMSWIILGFMLVVWSIVAVMLSLSTQKIGKLLRWMCLTMFVLLFVIFLRTLLLPTSWQALKRAFLMEDLFRIKPSSFIVQTFLSSSIIGSGWGSVITLASYNKFKSDIYKWSWTINGSLLGIIFITGLISLNLQIFGFDFTWHWETNDVHVSGTGIHIICVTNTLAFGKMEFANLWTFLFFSLLFLSEICSIVIQLYGVLTAVFDEYEEIRQYKRKFSYALIALLIFPSMLLCTRRGIVIFNYLENYQILTQMFLCLLMLIAVLWIYDRIQYQQDVEFMISRKFQTWKVYVIRTATPVYISILIVLSVRSGLLDMKRYPLSKVYLGACLKAISFGFVPVYIIVKLLQSSGPLLSRFQRLNCPNDWCPADDNDKQRYKMTFGDYSRTLMDELL